MLAKFVQWVAGVVQFIGKTDNRFIQSGGSPRLACAGVSISLAMREERRAVCAHRFEAASSILPFGAPAGHFRLYRKPAFAVRIGSGTSEPSNAPVGSYQTATAKGVTRS
jgi:hypothetical protein